TGVLPLVQEACGRGQRHFDDLVRGLLLRVAVLERVILEEVDVEAVLVLARECGLQVSVAGKHRCRAAALVGVDLVLRAEWRTKSRRTVRRAQLELIDSRNREILGY